MWNVQCSSLCSKTVTVLSEITKFQEVQILKVGGFISLSSAVVIFTENVYSEEFLETCILYFFNTGL
jgi:hypothetical protein